MTNQPIWQQQCDAARGIRVEFGSERALGYLVGEKLLNFIWASDRDATLATDLPRFVAEIKTIFPSRELHEYLANVRRVAPLPTRRPMRSSRYCVRLARLKTIRSAPSRAQSFLSG